MFSASKLVECEIAITVYIVRLLCLHYICLMIIFIKAVLISLLLSDKHDHCILVKEHYV